MKLRTFVTIVNSIWFVHVIVSMLLHPGMVLYIYKNAMVQQIAMHLLFIILPIFNIMAIWRDGTVGRVLTTIGNNICIIIGPGLLLFYLGPFYTSGHKLLWSQGAMLGLIKQFLFFIILPILNIMAIRSGRQKLKSEAVPKKGNTMKFGIIAAVLIMLVVPVMLDLFSSWKIPSSSVIPGATIAVYFAFIGPSSAFVTSILGIRFDKYKHLAMLTMLLSIAWIAVVCWVFFSLSTMGPW